VKNIQPLALAALVLASVAAPAPSRADDETAAAGQLDITSIGAVAAEAGETTILTFTVENDGAERANITGVALSTGERSRVMGAIGGEAGAEIGSLPLRPGQRVEFGPRSVWIEIGPLKADLKAGQLVPARLLLGSFEAPVTIHVTAPENLPTGSIRKLD
jgi:copper(I)-binding protein